MLDRPFDQTPSGREVHDVVLVDPRRAEQQRDRVHAFELWLVLNQLDQVAPVHNRAGRSGHVHADLESGRVDLRGPTTVVFEVAEHVLHALDQALATGLEGSADCLRVTGQRVSRSECVDDELRGEPRLAVLHPLKPGRVEQLGHQLGAQQVLLREQEVQRVVGKRRVGEPLVPIQRNHRPGCLITERAFGCRFQCCRHANREAAVGGCHPDRVLHECDAGCGERAKERDRIGAGERILGDAEAVEDRTPYRFVTVCCLHGVRLLSRACTRKVSAPLGR